MPKEAHETVSRAENWHQSGLEQITGCPRSWFLEHQLSLPTPGKATAVAGTAYHTAVEFHEMLRMQGEDSSREDMLAAGLEMLDLEIATVPPDVVAAVSVKHPKRGELTGVDALRHQLETAVSAFWDAEMESGLTIRDTLLQWTPLGLEVYGSAQIVDGARPLAGTIDGVYLDGDGNVLVVDHKTAARVTDWAKPGKGAEQATHYALLVYLDEKLAALHEALPTVGSGRLPVVHFLVASRTASARKAKQAVHVVTDVNPTDLHSAGVRVRAAEQLLVEGRFPANPAYQWCRTCPFRERCVAGTRELMAPVPLLLSEFAA
jgi:hypothetical protein